MLDETFLFDMTELISLILLILCFFDDDLIMEREIKYIINKLLSGS